MKACDESLLYSIFNIDDNLIARQTNNYRDIENHVELIASTFYRNITRALSYTDHQRNMHGTKQKNMRRKHEKSELARY